MTFGLGYRPDPTDHGLPLWSSSPRMHAALRATTARTVSVEQWVPFDVLNQGPVGSCFGHGTSDLLMTACAAAGRPLTFRPSPKGCYDVARLVERARTTPVGAKLPDLEDSGAGPADGIPGLRAVGIRPMGAPVLDEDAGDGSTRNSDCNAANVNYPPDLSELTTAAGHLIVGPKRIDYTAGSTVVSAVQATLGARASLGSGIFVDSRFQAWTPANGPLDGAPNYLDPQGGMHWIQVVAIETLANGKRVLKIKNSWGAGWGDHGYILVTENWFAQSYRDPTAFVVEQP